MDVTELLARLRACKAGDPPDFALACAALSRIEAQDRELAEVREQLRTSVEGGRLVLADLAEARAEVERLREIRKLKDNHIRTLEDEVERLKVENAADRLRLGLAAEQEKQGRLNRAPPQRGEAMTRFCANPACGRGFVDAKPAKRGVTPPLLCPTCRAKLGKAPLSRLVGGRARGEAEKAQRD